MSETITDLEKELIELENSKTAIENRAATIRKKIADEKKSNAPKSIIDKINDYNDILKISGVKESDDEVSVKGFDAAENEFVKNIIKKMRICKVYNEGKRLTKTDRRYYNWYDLSSGFVFDDAYCADSLANTASASRLCVDSSEKSKDILKKFPEVEQGIILK